MGAPLKRSAAAALCAALILVSPGPGAYAAFISGRAAPATSPISSFPAGLSPDAAGTWSPGLLPDMAAAPNGAPGLDLAAPAPFASAPEARALPAALTAPDAVRIEGVSTLPGGSPRAAAAAAGREIEPPSSQPQTEAQGGASVLGSLARLDAVSNSLRENFRSPASLRAEGARVFDRAPRTHLEDAVLPAAYPSRNFGPLQSARRDFHSEKAGSDNVPAVPEFHTDVAGQFAWGGVFWTAASLLGILGYYMFVAGWASPAVAGLGLAAWVAVVALGYTVLGSRLFASLWKFHSGLPFFSRLGRSLTETVAQPDRLHLALASFKDSPQVLDLIELHESPHRRGRGEIYAYLRQGLHHIRYLAREAAAIWSSVRRFLADWVAMAVGDRDLEHIIRPLHRRMLAVAALLIADAVLMASVSFMLGPLLHFALLAGSGGAAAHLWTLTALSAAIVVALILYALVERGHAYLGGMTGLESARNYRVALSKNLLEQDLDFHSREENSAGKLQSRILNDTNFLSQKNVSVRQVLPHYVLYFFLSTTVLVILSPQLSLLLLPALGLFGILSAVFGERLGRNQFDLSDMRAGLTSLVESALSNIGTVKTSGTEDQEAGRGAASADGIRTLEEKNVRLLSNYALFDGIGEGFFMNLLFALGGFMIAFSMGMTLDRIIQISIFAHYVMYSFRGLTAQYLVYKQRQGSARVVQDQLRLVPGMKDEPGARPLSEGSVRGEIEFKDVGFSDKEGRSILSGVSFKVQPGQKIAFVGKRGSGKSTILRLLLRFWDPAGGRVLVDGQDVRGVTRASLLQGIAAVPQSPSLFKGTLRENILYGRSDASPEDLARALRISGMEAILQDARRFPAGLDTPVAEGGGDLSGGQQKSVALARALVRSSPVLVLDEATSALDYQTEAEVARGLNGLVSPATGRRPTMLVVAHRLSTIQDADRIFFLDEGRIQEQGTHEELMARGGGYADLYRQQQLEQDPRAEQAAPASAAASAGDSGSAPSAQPSAPSEPASAAPSAEKPPSRMGALGRKAAALWRVLTGMALGDKEARPYLRPYRLAVLAAVGFLFLDAAGGIALAKMIGGALDAAAEAATSGSLESLAWFKTLAFSVIGLGLAAPFITRWKTLITGVLNARLVRNLRDALQRKLMAREMAFHRQNAPDELSSRVVNDVETLARRNVDLRMPLIKHLLMLAGSLVLMSFMNPWVAGVVLVVGLVLGPISGYFGAKLEKVATDFSKRRADLGGYAGAMMARIRLIKIFGTEKKELEQFGARAQALVEVGRERSRLGANRHALTSSLTDFFTKYFIYIVGAWFIALAWGMTVGDITALTLLAKYFKDSLDGLSSSWVEFKSAEGETEVVRGLLAEKSALEDAPDAVDLPASAPGAVEFRGVDFAYQPGAEQGALRGVSFTINPGERVAVVGSRGSGKSTVLRLIQRQWDAGAGQVLVDGRDVRKIRKKSLVAHLASVLQDTEIFPGTLEHNLRYGAGEVAAEELWEAIRAVGAEDFVSRKGLDFKVDRLGEGLSGGEKQSVALVRAWLKLKKARILLLDEATASLDKVTEALVKRALARLHPTMLVVAHNLETISDADRILVMDGGRIVQSGTHRQLLEDPEGRYYQLWHAREWEKAVSEPAP